MPRSFYLQSHVSPQFFLGAFFFQKNFLNKKLMAKPKQMYVKISCKFINFNFINFLNLCFQKTISNFDKQLVQPNKQIRS
ncbi:MAG: hypothetical protein RI980_173 [Bacteroidota bacterium]|jgi:hypothetical protein